MAETIDARGLSCPQPVLLTKKAIAKNEEVTVIVDHVSAAENIRRLAGKMACDFSVTDQGGGTLKIVLIRKGVGQVPVESETVAGVARWVRP